MYEHKNEITEFCCIFRKIVKENKFLLIAQVIIYLFLMDRVFTILLDERFYLPFVILLLLIGEIIITTVLRNAKGNIIGLCTDCVLTVLLFYFHLAEFNILPFAVVSVIIHIFRIQSISAVNRLQNIYGYPGFHDFFINNEGRSDEKFLDTVLKQYREVSNLKVIRYEIAKQKARTSVKVMQVGGFVLCLIGLVLFSNVYFQIKKIDNAQIVDSVKNCVDGTYINCSVEKLLCQTAFAIDSIAEDSYWGQMGNDLAVFYVPDTYKKQFAMLYNYYAKTNESGMEEGYYEGAYDVKEKSSEAIKCIGKICSVSKYDDKDVNKHALDKIKTNSLKINDEFYIEIIDVSKLKKHRNVYMALTVSGALLTFAGLFIGLKKYE